MSQSIRIVTLTTFAALAVAPAAAQTAVPDLRGTWKGESQSIVRGGAHPHHPGTPADEPRLHSTPFTLTIDKQDGRRFSGTFSSARANDPVIAVISHDGTIFLVDDDGYTRGQMLAPNRMEVCYMHLSSAVRVASCTELTKQ
jgi:hypothetical protein